jgi:hypothetical protein
VLIAGEPRLTAAKVLGWTEIPVTVVDLGEIVRGEFAETGRSTWAADESIKRERLMVRQSRDGGGPLNRMAPMLKASVETPETEVPAEDEGRPRHRGTGRDRLRHSGLRDTVRCQPQGGGDDIPTRASGSGTCCRPGN